MRNNQANWKRVFKQFFIFWIGNGRNLSDLATFIQAGGKMLKNVFFDREVNSFRNKQLLRSGVYNLENCFRKFKDIFHIGRLSFIAL